MLVRNSLAHLAARVTSLAAGLVTIPLVTMTLGTEALGLAGAYATLQAMVGLFDLGVPTAASRELAVLIGRRASPRTQAVLVRSLEVLFWAMAVAFCLIGFAFAGALAESWFNVQVISREVVYTSLLLIIAGVAARFPVAFYSNIFFALGRHAYPNAVLSISSVVRTVVAVIALIKFDVGLVGLFVIQLLFNAVEAALLVFGVWWSSKFKFLAPRLQPLRRVARQAGILTVIALTAVALSQVDKIVLSRILTLGDFGVYSAAYTLASGLLALAYPVGNAIFPELNQSLDRGRSDAAARLLRLGTEMTILIVVPLGATIAMQAEPVLDILFLVKKFPPDLAAILPLMMLGGIAQAFVTLPHLFQVAAGRAQAVLWINVAFLLPYILLVAVLTQAWGIWGAAAAFAIFNIARLLLHWALLLMDKYAGNLWRAVPISVVAINAVCFALAWATAMLPGAKLSKMVLAGVTAAIITLVVAMCLPASRGQILAKLQAGSAPAARSRKSRK